MHFAIGKAVYDLNRAPPTSGVGATHLSKLGERKIVELESKNCTFICQIAPLVCLSIALIAVKAIHSYID